MLNPFSVVFVPPHCGDIGTSADSVGYLSVGTIEKYHGSCDLSVREKTWRGELGLSAHAQQTEPSGETLGTRWYWDQCGYW